MLRARTDQAKDQRRQVFLHAALDEFFERGFTAARMDDIARRAGLSKGALYLYFDSKEALFTALVTTIAIPNVERIEGFAASAVSASAGIHALLSHIPHIIRETQLPRFMKVLIADSGVFPEVVSNYRRQVIDRALKAITSLLEYGHSNGEFKVDNPALTTRLLVAPMIFSSIWSVVFETDPDAHIDFDALFALHERMLLRALSPELEGSL